MARKKPDFSDKEAWSLEALERVRARIVRELERRERLEQQAAMERAPKAGPAAAANESELSAFEEALRRDIERHKRRSRAGVIRI